MNDKEDPETHASMDVEPARFKAGNKEGGGMVRLKTEWSLVKGVGRTWTDTNGLGGESDVVGGGHYNIESKERLKTAERRLQMRAGVVEGEILCILDP